MGALLSEIVQSTRRCKAGPRESTWTKFSVHFKFECTSSFKAHNLFQQMLVNLKNRGHREPGQRKDALCGDSFRRCIIVTSATRGVSRVSHAAERE